MKKSLTFWNMLPWLLIISGVLLLISRVLIKRMKAKAGTETLDNEPIEAEEVEEIDEPNKEQRILNIFQVVRRNIPGAWSDDTAKMIVAQAMHETGNFTSRLYKEQNNLFGMRQPAIRETLSIEGRNGFATFGSLDDSVKDLLLYFKEFSLEPNKWDKPHAYVKAIKNAGYFTDDFLSYYNAMRTHYNTVKALIQ